MEGKMPTSQLLNHWPRIPQKSVKVCREWKVRCPRTSCKPLAENPPKKRQGLQRMEGKMPTAQLQTTYREPPMKSFLLGA